MRAVTSSFYPLKFAARSKYQEPSCCSIHYPSIKCVWFMKALAKCRPFIDCVDKGLIYDVQLTTQSIFAFYSSHTYPWYQHKCVGGGGGGTKNTRARLE